MKRKLAILPALLGLGVGVAGAGEVGVVSNARVQVSVDGRVLGIFGPGRVIPVRGLEDGFHKVRVRAMASGETRTFKAPMPFLDGQRFEARFQESPSETDSRQAASPVSPSPRRAPSRPIAEPLLPPGPSRAPVASVPPGVPPGEETRVRNQDVRDLVNLQELSQGLVEDLAEDVATLRDQVRALERGRPQASPSEPAPATGSGAPGPRAYAMVEAEYTDTDEVQDHGSFDVSHAYLGLTGAVAPRWEGRVEWDIRHGFQSSAAGTTGEVRLSRASLTHHGEEREVTLGKVFTPFGYWSRQRQGVYKGTIQDPLMFDNLYAGNLTGVTSRWTLEDGLAKAYLGLYNGEGALPHERDDNDNKSLLLGFETHRFARGTFGVWFNRQRDGNQADRVERKWIFSTEQHWDRLRLLAEFFHEEAPRLGGIAGTDSFYSDLRYSLRDDLSLAYRWDTVQHDPRAGGGSHWRNLVNLQYELSPLLRVKADWYHDRFQDPTRLSSNGFDVAVAGAIGL